MFLNLVCRDIRRMRWSRVPTERRRSVFDSRTRSVPHREYVSFPLLIAGAFSEYAVVDTFRKSTLDRRLGRLAQNLRS